MSPVLEAPISITISLDVGEAFMMLIGMPISLLKLPMVLEQLVNVFEIILVVLVLPLLPVTAITFP